MNNEYISTLLTDSELSPCKEFVKTNINRMCNINTIYYTEYI